MKNALQCLFCTLLLLTLFNIRCAQAVMLGLSTEELVKNSELVIAGRVEDTSCFWSADNTTIYTRATIVVEETVRGRAQDTRLVVEFEGGEVGGKGLKVSDVSPLLKGEKVILFLKSARSLRLPATDVQTAEYVYKIVADAQGKYTVNESGIAEKKGFSLIRGKEVIDNNIPAAELIKKIKAVK